MDIIPFKETIKNRLIESARKYQSLIGKRIVVASESFVMKKEYIVHFYLDQLKKKKMHMFIKACAFFF